MLPPFLRGEDEGGGRANLPTVLLGFRAPPDTGLFEYGRDLMCGQVETCKTVKHLYCVNDAVRTTRAKSNRVCFAIDVELPTWALCVLANGLLQHRPSLGIGLAAEQTGDVVSEPEVRVAGIG